MKVLMPIKPKAVADNKGTSLMKMLLTNRMQAMPKVSKEKESTSARSLPYSGYRRSVKAPDPENCRMTEYVNKVSGINKVEENIILRDHPYARSTNWHAANYLAKPRRHLFFPTTLKAVLEDVEEINVEEVILEPIVPFLPQVSQLQETNRDAEVEMNSEDESSSWDDKISRVGWSAAQIRILPKMVRLLDDVELPRLTYKGLPNGQLQMDVAMNSLASRLSSLLASVSWDKYITQWLHAILMEKALPQQKKDYLDLLGVLKRKVPTLVERMVTPMHMGRSTVTKETDQFGVNITTKSNRVEEILVKESFCKLPHGPVFLLIPPLIDPEKSERLSSFLTQLRQMAQVFVVNFSSVPASTSISQCLDQMMVETRAKITEIRSDYSGRPLILIGWTLGSSIACLVAQLEPAHAIICLGFPMKTTDGNRGEPDDPVLDTTCPVLFMIGDEAILVRPDDLEEMRSRMKVLTQMVILGSCNDRLLMNRNAMINHAVTQTMIDRAIALEVFNFVGELLTQPPLPPPRPVMLPVVSTTEGKRGAANKRKFVIAEVKDSPPQTPPAKRQKIDEKLSSHFMISEGNVIAVPPNSPPKRKSRMTSTQKLMLNSAKYAAELPPDYAAKLQQVSASAHSEMPMWTQGKCSTKPPQLSNLLPPSKPGRLAKTQDAPTRRVVSTPSLIGEPVNKNATPLSRPVSAPGVAVPKRPTDTQTQVVHINRPRNVNMIRPGSTLLLKTASPKATKAVLSPGGGSTLIASHVKPLGNLKSIMSLPPRMSRYVTSTTKPTDGSKLTVIHTNMDFSWLSKTGDAKKEELAAGDERQSLISTVSSFAPKTVTHFSQAPSNASISSDLHLNKPMSLNDEMLTPDAILQLPIIFAKDDENIFDLPVQNSLSHETFTLPLEGPSTFLTSSRLAVVDGKSTAPTNVIVISSDSSSALKEPSIKAPKKYTRRTNLVSPVKYAKVIMNPRKVVSEIPRLIDTGLFDINLPELDELSDQTYQCMD